MAQALFMERHSRAINIGITICLGLLIVISHILVVLLFMDASLLRIPSLLAPVDGPKPETVSTLLGTVIVGTISAFVSRCVEQSLWLKIASPRSEKQLTASECHNLAQWSVSPSARLLYVFKGQNFMLKIAGPLLLAVSVVSPVLVSGISLTQLMTTTTTWTPASQDLWAGWLDPANEAYHGGTFQDVPGDVAALAYLNNLTAPSSNICSGVENCQAKAIAASLHATCQFGSQPHSAMDGNNTEYETYASNYNPNISVTLNSGPSYTYANFTGGDVAPCDWDPLHCPPGMFAVIFGSFVNNSANINITELPYLNTVDCLLTFGTVNITQSGGDAPNIEPNSYVQNLIMGPDGSVIDGGLFTLHRIYTEAVDRSPYSFTAAAGGDDGSDLLYNSPVGTLLLTSKAHTSASQVAEKIEQMWEMATLMAFARSPQSADVLLTSTTATQVYVYHRLVLLILLVPLLALLFGGYGRCRVEGKDIFVGYDPAEIAKRGPFVGSDSEALLVDPETKAAHPYSTALMLDKADDEQPSVHRSLEI